MKKHLANCVVLCVIIVLTFASGYLLVENKRISKHAIETLAFSTEMQKKSVENIQISNWCAAVANFVCGIMLFWKRDLLGWRIVWVVMLLVGLVSSSMVTMILY